MIPAGTVIPFIKMHGCGNDYVFLDCISHPVPSDPSQLARIISDRHAGVGADGLVLMRSTEEPAEDDSGDSLRSERPQVRMQMFNADGSEGAMCGNALRCIALWMHAERNENADITISTASGIVHASILSIADNGRSGIVRVDMGHPSDPAGNPLREDSQLAPVDLIVPPDLSFTAYRVSMGNPHAVVLVDDVVRVPLVVWGPAIETNPVFPDRTNVEFARIVDREHVRVSVWERGSGATQACGSGAAAVAAAGILLNRLAPATPIAIHLPGGTLHVTWSPGHPLLLEGPATESFRGTFSI